MNFLPLLMRPLGVRHLKASGFLGSGSSSHFHSKLYGWLVGFTMPNVLLQKKREDFNILFQFVQLFKNTSNVSFNPANLFYIFLCQLKVRNSVSEPQILIFWLIDLLHILYTNSYTVELYDPGIGVKGRAWRCATWSPHFRVTSRAIQVVGIFKFKVTVWHQTLALQTNDRSLCSLLKVRNTVNTWITILLLLTLFKFH